MRGSVAILALLAAAGASRAEEPAGRVVLRWQAVPEAASYDLQIAKDDAFTARELEARVQLNGFRLEPPPEARRFWRVRSVDAEGRPGPWSRAKTIEPLVPVAEPGPATLDVPPVAPVAIAAAGPQPRSERTPDLELDPHAGEQIAPPLDDGIDGVSGRDVLLASRPGALLGWRSNLLGVAAPTVAVEAACQLPWFGARWGASLRLGWWGERVTVPASVGITDPLDASADVFTLALLAVHSFPQPWARLYAGAGAGLHLALIRLRDEGALEASPALELVGGAGLPMGPGELFGELSAGLGGVDGPLGRLRTGGIAVSLGYRLGP
jgi:hypothetical protein